MKYAPELEFVSVSSNRLESETPNCRMEIEWKTEIIRREITTALYDGFQATEMKIQFNYYHIVFATIRNGMGKV